MTLNTRESLGPIWPRVYADTVRRGNTQTYEEFITEMKEDQIKKDAQEMSPEFTE